MTTIRTALTMAIQPGAEARYRTWLTGAIDELAILYARTGVLSKTVMVAGRTLISHYECERPDSVAQAFAQPEAVAMMNGPLSSLLDPTVPPAFYENLLTWRNPVNYVPIHAALMLNVKPGQEAAYRQWAQHGAAAQFDAVWRRHNIALKEILISGTSLISHYECRDHASILATFGEPEAAEAMATNLGPLLELDPTKPLEVFEEVLTWKAPLLKAG
ncbi:MAG: hypothetical protein ACO213_12970 [Steroidobacteraceae bacterium]